MLAFRQWGPKTVLLAFCAPGLALSVAARALLPKPWSALVFMGVWSAMAGAGLLVYWRRLDEAAREAQKSAWLWGGGFGLLVGYCGLVVGRELGLDAPTRLAAAEPLMLMVIGAAVVTVTQFTGFLVAWAFWWAKAR